MIRKGMITQLNAFSQSFHTITLKGKRYSNQNIINDEVDERRNNK
jgi:hypothetical protein